MKVKYLKTMYNEVKNIICILILVYICTYTDKIGTALFLLIYDIISHNIILKHKN